MFLIMKAYFAKRLLIAIFLLICPFVLIAGDPLAQVTNRLERTVRREHIVGMACAIFYKGEGHVFCFGQARLQPRAVVSPNTIFDLASLTKVFTATDLALQIDCGRMALEDPVTKYITALRNTSLQQVSLLRLATHTASLPDSLPGAKTRSDAYEALRMWQPPYAIGSQYHYSNVGFWLLRYALEAATDESYEDLLRKDLFQPLGMYSTMISVSPADDFRYAQGYSKEAVAVARSVIGPGGGSLKSTPADMLRFLRACLGIATQPKLKKAMEFAQTGRYKVNDHLTMGLSWQRFTRNGLEILDKNGAVPGFSSYIGLVQDQKFGIVILANTQGVACTRLGRSILFDLATYH